MTARRERRLVSIRHRRMVASGLENLVARAERGTELSAAARPSYAAVRGARHALLALADELRDLLAVLVAIAVFAVLFVLMEGLRRI